MKTKSNVTFGNATRLVMDPELARRVVYSTNKMSDYSAYYPELRKDIVILLDGAENKTYKCLSQYERRTGDNSVVSTIKKSFSEKANSIIIGSFEALEELFPQVTDHLSRLKNGVD